MENCTNKMKHSYKTLLLMLHVCLVSSDNITERAYRGRSPFPCDTDYEEPWSGYRRRTVHSLRPKDVDIVASVGDSITAGLSRQCSQCLV